MSVLLEEDIRQETLQAVAERMLIAARTAPKARGIDNLEMAIADKEEIQRLSEKLQEMAGREERAATFTRDAENILSADRIVLIGTRIESLGLKACSLCGFLNCDEKDQNPDVPCVFNAGDLGIAVGSAVSVAMDNRVDNRVMYSVGQAAVELGLLGTDTRIALGIPLSATGKNPFFDRR